MPKLRCVVLANDSSTKEALWVKKCLSVRSEIDLHVDTFSSPVSDSSPQQLFIVVVGVRELPSAAAVLAAINTRSATTPILVVGVDLSQEHISLVLSQGAYDYVSIHSSDEELLARFFRGVRFLSMHSSSQVSQDSRLAGLVGSSSTFVKLLSRLPVLAGCNSNVLIQGETGTGKELFAHAIHYLSKRDSQPWVPINCGAIPHELIEAELFGHVKGAYTSAHFAREGLVATAEGGSLFLDEIDSLPPSLQAKLLRFLQEKEYRPVGSNVVRRADVRVIAASNVDLPKVVTEGRFRQDLYFRLNVLNLRLPSLRERKDDIPALAMHFVRRFSAEFKKSVHGLTPAALACLQAHAWPGNVRELSHTIERSVLLCQGRSLTPADIDLGYENLDETEESFRTAKARVIEQFERNYLEKILMVCNGNISHAAKAAKKNRRALWELIRKHGIEVHQFRSQAQ